MAGANRRQRRQTPLINQDGKGTPALVRFVEDNAPGGGGGATNLGYTASPTGGTVTSDTGADATLTLADGTNAGLMAPAQHTKLAGIGTSATANDTDANLKARANHTGTQAASTISDFSEAVDDRVATLLVAGSGVTLTYNDAANTLTVAATGGGSDPWTYVKLSSDFTTSSATAVDITGLAFTPDADTQYEFEACLFLRTATTTVGPRPGIKWATIGLTDGVVSIYQTSSVSAEVQQHGDVSLAVLSPVGGLPTTTRTYAGRVIGAAIMGGSPTGDIQITLASETGGTNVTARTGSYLKYRAIP
jgi:hypothetical protein